MNELRRRVCPLVVAWLLLHFVAASAVSVLVNRDLPDGKWTELRCDTGIGITMPHGRVSVKTLKIKSLTPVPGQVIRTPQRLFLSALLLLLALAVVRTPLFGHEYLRRFIRPPDARLTEI